MKPNTRVFLVALLVIINSCLSLNIKSVSDKIATSQDIEFYFSHEMNTNFAKKAIKYGYLRATKFITLSEDVQAAKLGKCEAQPIIFLRIFHENDTGKLNFGSNGSSGAIMFILNKNLPSYKYTPGVALGLDSDIEKYNETFKDKPLDTEKFGKFCYAENYDVGKNGFDGSVTGAKFYSFNDSESVYKSVTRDNAEIKSNNEQGVVGAINLKEYATAILIKVNTYIDSQTKKYMINVVESGSNSALTKINSVLKKNLAVQTSKINSKDTYVNDRFDDTLNKLIALIKAKLPKTKIILADKNGKKINYFKIAQAVEKGASVSDLKELYKN